MICSGDQYSFLDAYSVPDTGIGSRAGRQTHSFVLRVCSLEERNQYKQASTIKCAKYYYRGNATLKEQI